MLRTLLWLPAGVLAALAVLSSSSARAQEKDELVANPRYMYWAAFKPGSTVTHTERTVFGEPSAKLLAPDGVDEKVITYKLIVATPEKVVLETVVVERDFLSTIEQAPTKITFLAKVRKTHLETALREAGAKAGEETIEVVGKQLRCKTLAGAYKESGDDIERKVWFTDAVPGGIVKQVRTTKHDGQLVAETTTTLKSFKKAE
jgi:hypothetical protein